MRLKLLGRGATMLRPNFFCAKKISEISDAMHRHAQALGLTRKNFHRTIRKSF
jgi:hypothetical protein